MSTYTLWRAPKINKKQSCSQGCGRRAVYLVDRLPVCQTCLPEPCPKCGRFCFIGMFPSGMCGRQGESAHGPIYAGPAQRFDPVVVHFNPTTGEYRFPGAAHAKAPAGYQRQELTTTHDVRKFTKRWNESERRKVDESVCRSQQRIEMSQARHRPDLRMAMQGMSEFGRDFARLAMEINDRRGAKRHFDPGCHLEAFEMDRSNRDAHQDGQQYRMRRRD